MISVSRFAISLIGILFGLFHAVLGFYWVASYIDPGLGIAALVLYVVAILTTMGLYRGLHMPVVQAVFNALVAIALPLIVNPLIADGSHNTFATWYVGGLGVLLSATAVRQHRTIAWVATGLVTVIVVYWGGLTAIYDSGLIGMVLLVAAGQALSLGVERASLDVKRLGDQAQAEASEAAATTAQRLERQVRLQQALSASRPILERIVASGGQLSSAEQLESRLAEAALRDEIRGRSLINARVRDAVRLARLRGVEVLLLDEGGLDECEPDLRERLLGDVANAVDGIAAGKVTVRSPQGEPWMLTLVALSPGSAVPDLWLKLP
jgi:hypothetical protein